jgi:transcriptional regulator with XRE-family HTH domain
MERNKSKFIKTEKQVTNGKRITELMIASGHNARSLGERLGVSQQTVSRWTHGTAFPKAFRLTELAKILNVEVSELLSLVESERDGGENVQ